MARGEALARRRLGPRSIRLSVSFGFRRAGRSGARAEGRGALAHCLRDYWCTVYVYCLSVLCTTLLSVVTGCVRRGA